MDQPVIPASPPYPQQSDPANFADKAETWSAAQDGITTAMNLMGDYITEKATSATTSETNAAASAIIATAGANYAGSWSSLVGALNKPASVTHNNRYWLLLNNLADVTTSQPGVSADWQEYRTVNAFSVISTSAYFI